MLSEQRVPAIRQANGPARRLTPCFPSRGSMPAIRGSGRKPVAIGRSSFRAPQVESLAVGGTATVVGVLPTGAMIEFPWEAVGHEK